MLGDPAYHLRTSRVDQTSQLFQMFGDMPSVGRSLSRGSNQYHALNGISDGYQWSNGVTWPVMRVLCPE